MTSRQLATLTLVTLAIPVIFDYGIKPLFFAGRATVKVYDSPERLDKVEAKVDQIETSDRTNFEYLQLEMRGHDRELKKIEGILTKSQTNGAPDDPAGYFSIVPGQPAGS